MPPVQYQNIPLGCLVAFFASLITVPISCGWFSLVRTQSGRNVAHMLSIVSWLVLSLFIAWGFDRYRTGTPFSEEEIRNFETAASQVTSKAADDRLGGLRQVLPFCSLTKRCVARRHLDRYTKAWQAIRTRTVQLVNDPEAAVRDSGAAAFRCFWSGADAKAKTTLMARLQDAEEPIEHRTRLILLWADTEHPQAANLTQNQLVSQLRPLLDDRSPEIVRTTCAALSKGINKHKIAGHFGASAAKATIKAMVALLDRPEPSVRLAALTTLREIKEIHGDYNWFRYALLTGHLDKIVSKGLEKAKQDNDRHVRDLATKPLEVKPSKWKDW